MNAPQLIRHYQEKSGALCSMLVNHLEVVAEGLARQENPVLYKDKMLELIETMAKIEALERVVDESQKEIAKDEK